MSKVQIKVQVKGIVKEIKNGESKKGKWTMLSLENGKGFENIFVDDNKSGKKVEKGSEVTIIGELWKNKNKNYNYEFKKMVVADVTTNDEVAF